ncbi:hypothetical protein QE152_g8862 [Popillia japonica]|uniref:Uncharacterized protein n=1 Tax=Popillia japonica TaxID=7064 RepID=A0AAW1LWI7_POPJA
MLKTVYDDNTISCTTGFDWFKRLDGCESVEVDDRAGLVSRNADSIAKVGELVARDRRMSLGLMAVELNINTETVRQILHEDLGLRTICAAGILRMNKNREELQRAKTKQIFGIIHKGFVPEGQSVNGPYYLGMMEEITEAHFSSATTISRKR